MKKLFKTFTVRPDTIEAFYGNCACSPCYSCDCLACVLDNAVKVPVENAGASPETGPSTIYSYVYTL